MIPKLLLDPSLIFIGSNFRRIASELVCIFVKALDTPVTIEDSEGFHALESFLKCAFSVIQRAILGNESTPRAG
jgi:hypothetical protein